MDSGSDKKIYYLAVFVGSAIGGYLPAIFGISLFSITDLLTGAVGAIIAIYITYKIIG